MSKESTVSSTAPRKSKAFSRAGKIVIIVVCWIFSIVILGPMLVLEIPFKLLSGWFSFLQRVIPQVSWNMSMIGSSLVILLLAGLGFHFLARTFKSDWRGKWTVGWIVMGGLLFYASIATTGMAHQIAWLTREPIGSMRSYENIRSISSMRQIVLGLRVYESDYAAVPEQIYDLYPEYIDSPLSEESFWHFKHRGEIAQEFLYFPESYQLLDQGMSAPDTNDAKLIILASPPSTGKRIVAYYNGSVSRIEEEEFQALTSAQQKQIIDRAKSRHSSPQK
ncbi:MAG: hypothetical protein P1V20_30700 [Verrucomicrobiales bacterium]|nr:hypothetical protein [Verrucomicrobiales bacterium]